MASKFEQYLQILTNNHKKSVSKPVETPGVGGVDQPEQTSHTRGNSPLRTKQYMRTIEDSAARMGGT